jgi:hypothetical protein
MRVRVGKSEELVGGRYRSWNGTSYRQVAEGVGFVKLPVRACGQCRELIRSIRWNVGRICSFVGSAQGFPIASGYIAQPHAVFA